MSAPLGVDRIILREEVGTMNSSRDGIASMQRIFSGSLGLAALAALLLTAGPAVAQEEDDSKQQEETELSPAEKKQFQTHVEKGKKAFSVDDYEEALEHFEKAYDLKPTPNLLFNMGLVAEQAGNLEEALERYEEFVVSPGVSLNLRKKAQKRIEALEPIVEDQQAKEQKSEEKKGSAPEELADSEKGGKKDEKKADETDTEESGSGASLGGAFALVGGGVAAIGGGVAFTLLSQSARKRVSSGNSPGARRDAQAAAYRNQWIADGLFVAGLGLATAGVIVWTNASNGGSGGSSGSSAALAPTVGPNFAGLRLRGRF